MSHTLLLVLYLACVLASAFFAASETALTSLSEAALYRIRERGSPKAETLQRLRANLPATLGTILIGNTLVNIAAGAIGTAVAIDLLGERAGVLVATVGTTIVLLVAGEVTPKTFAARRPETVSLLLAGPVAFLARLATPLTRILSALANALISPLDAARPSSEAASSSVTSDDVRSLIALSHERGGIQDEEKEILHAVLAFGDKTVRAAMVPRAQMACLPLEAGFETVRAACRAHRYSRFPVFRGGQDEIVGILHVKYLFDVSDEDEKTFSPGRFLHPALFVPELSRADELFHEMRRRRLHMAIVVDEHGSVSGLVTLEDLIEEVLGEIADEHDEPAVAPVLDGASILVEGSYRLSDLQRHLGRLLEAGNAETVAGFLLQKLGRIPRPGARLRDGDLHFVVESASARAVERVRITRATSAAPVNPVTASPEEPGPHG